MPDGTDTTGLEFLEWKLRWEAHINERTTTK